MARSKRKTAVDGGVGLSRRDGRPKEGSRKRRNIRGFTEPVSAFKLTKCIIVTAGAGFGDPEQYWGADRVNKLFTAYLNSIALDVNWMMDANRNGSFDATGYSTTGHTLNRVRYPDGHYEYASMVVREPDPSFIEAFNVKKITTSLASSMLSGYLKRDDVATMLDTYGWDTSLADAKRHMHDMYGEDRSLPATLLKNVKASGTHPSVPFLERGKHIMSKTATQAGTMVVTTSGVFLMDVAIGPERIDAFYPCEGLADRYPHAYKYTRPTFYYDRAGILTADFTAMECIAKPGAGNTGSVLAIDLGGLNNRPFAAVRMMSDGTTSRSMGPSRELEAVIRARNTILENLRNMERKDDETRKHGIDTSTCKRYQNRQAEHEHLHEKLKKYDDDILNRIADEIISLALPGEAIILENLRYFQGTSDFPHGKVITRIQHMAERRGIRTYTVNPAGTSRNCPVCGARRTLKDVRREGKYRIRKCTMCGYEDDRDTLAAMVIALRGYEQLARHARNKVKQPPAAKPAPRTRKARPGRGRKTTPTPRRATAREARDTRPSMNATDPLEAGPRRGTPAGHAPAQVRLGKKPARLPDIGDTATKRPAKHPAHGGGGTRARVVEGLDPRALKGYALEYYTPPELITISPSSTV